MSRLISIILVAILTFSANVGEVFASDLGRDGEKRIVFLGNINNGSGSGVYSCLQDLENGVLSDLRKEATPCEPSFLVLDADCKLLYTFGRIGGDKSRVYSFRIGGDGRSLTAVDSTDALDAVFCHISLSKDEKRLFCSSYDNGLLVNLGVKSGRFTGKNDTWKQEYKNHRSFVHSALQDPMSDVVYCADLGLDKVFGYRFTKLGGQLVGQITVDGGSGPRHVAFSPDGRFMAVANELNHSVNIYKRNSEGFFGDLIQSVDLHPYPSKVTNYGADVKYSPDGRFLYANLRGDCSVVKMYVGGNGLVNIGGWQGEGMNWCRQFEIDPSGRFMLLTNHRGNNAIVYKIDSEDGSLRKINSFVELNGASCVVYNSKKLWKK